MIETPPITKSESAPPPPKKKKGPPPLTDSAQGGFVQHVLNHPERYSTPILEAVDEALKKKKAKKIKTR